jgi:hypothetical protein
MTDIYVAKLDWTGTYGHTGISRFAFVAQDGSVPTNTQRDGVLSAVMAFANTNSGGMPVDLSWQVDPIIESFDGLTGAITGELPPGSGGTPGHGSATGNYSNGVGLLVHWKTGGMFGGRRIQGRTFVVPMESGQFTTDGHLQDEAVTTWTTVANDYISAMGALSLSPLVWGRPADVAATPKKPAHHNAGHWAPILTATIDNKPAILGRRR